MAAGLVRAPTESYANCLRGDTSRRIDVPLALRQHEAYCAALKRCGVEPIPLPPEPGFPDACFVEDTAVIANGRAVITRPGAESRRGEIESVAAHLKAAHRITRGFVDGGDVLVADGIAFAGLSSRTDLEGIRELEKALEIDVRPVKIGKFLHLKTAVTRIGPKRLIQIEGAFPAGTFPGFEIVETPEYLGGNVLLAGTGVIVSAGAPKTAKMLNGVTVDIGEFHAGDAGLTCLSLLL